MKIRLLLLFLGMAGLLAAQTSRMPNPDSYVDMSKLSVRQFFDRLKIDSTDQDPVNFVIVTIESPENWIKKQDVAYFMKFIESKERCRCVVNSFSSYLPLKDRSSLGGQAMNLIDAYRFKERYTPGRWNCALNDETRVAEIRKWWKSVNKK